MELNLFAITVQAVGTLLVAGLLWQLTHLVSGGFLRYWSVGWVALAVALFVLRVSVSDGVPPAVARVGLSLYCAAEYLFAFLLWAGFRDFTRSRRVGRVDLWLGLPLAAVAVAGPVIAPDLNRLFPFHAPILAGLFALSLWEAWKYRPPRHSAGLGAVRGLLAALTLLFFHYGPVFGWAAFVAEEKDWAYLNLTPVYDALIELGLAFAVVVMTVERVRDEAAAKNQELADATRRLAEAARTDALTGLLNRRAFEELPPEPGGRAFVGTLAVIDMNDLKLLNDRYGHPAGDAALQTLARALRNAFRVTDPLFRIGGDEFVVVVEELGETELRTRLQRLDAALSQVRLPGVPGATAIRLAWGVAGFADAAGFAAAVSAADRAMYVRKKVQKGGTVSDT